MTFRSCSHEAEVKLLLDRGQWPQAAPADLRAHVAGCRKCGDLSLVMEAFGRARTAAMQTLPPQAMPDQAAGVLWWRAQLRRRKAAVEAMGRPILTAQIFGLAVTVLATVAMGLSQLGSGMAWLAELKKSRVFHLDALWTSASSNAASTASNVHPEWSRGLMLPAALMVLVLGGVVVYLASGLDSKRE
jgi:hypothetical protein